MQGVGGMLVVQGARFGPPDRVPGLVPIDARCAGRDRVRRVIQIAARCGGCGTMRVWSAHAGANPERRARSPNTPFQPTAACAIVRFLAVCAARWRQLNGNPWAALASYAYDDVCCLSIRSGSLSIDWTMVAPTLRPIVVMHAARFDEETTNKHQH